MLINKMHVFYLLYWNPVFFLVFKFIFHKYLSTFHALQYISEIPSLWKKSLYLWRATFQTTTVVNINKFSNKSVQNESFLYINEQSLVNGTVLLLKFYYYVLLEFEEEKFSHVKCNMLKHSCSFFTKNILSNYLSTWLLCSSQFLIYISLQMF